MKVGDLVEHKYYKKKIGVIKYRCGGEALPDAYRVLWFDDQEEAIEWHNVIRVIKSQADKKCP